MPRYDTYEEKEEAKRESIRKYQNSEKFKEVIKRYQQTDKYKDYKREYNRQRYLEQKQAKLE